MGTNLKKMVRDVQERTGWKYAFALHLVRELRYETVSEAIDAAIEKEGKNVDLYKVGTKLNALVKTKLHEELGIEGAVEDKDVLDTISGRHVADAADDIAREGANKPEVIVRRRVLDTTNWDQKDIENEVTPWVDVHDKIVSVNHVKGPAPEVEVIKAHRRPTTPFHHECGYMNGPGNKFCLGCGKELK